jgi:hypothetical protein
MTISNRPEFDAAIRRQLELQRQGGTDPAKQRELRELTERIEAYRRVNPDAATPPPGTANVGGTQEQHQPDFSGQSVYDPHNQNNVKPAPDTADPAQPARTPQSPTQGGLGHPGGVPGSGTPGGGTNT